MLKRGVLLAVIFLSTVCCRKNLGIEGAGGSLPSVPEGYVLTALDLSVSESEDVHSKASADQEDAYDDSYVWVLLFRKDGEVESLVQAPVKAVKSGGKLYAILRAISDPATVWFATGLTADLNTYMGTGSNFPEGSTMDDVRVKIKTAPITESGVPVGGTNPVNYIPMKGAVSLPGGTVGQSDLKVHFERIAAKINVDASAVSSDFVLEGVTLVNGFRRSYIFSQLPVDENDELRYNEVTGVSDNKVVSQIYLYGNTGKLNNGKSNPTKIVVRGRYKGVLGYHRLDILNTSGDKPYEPMPVMGNTIYTVKIGRIETVGYSTREEAEVNTPSNNIDYKVEATDPWAHDVVTNGEYFIGVSNSEFIIYVNDATINTPVLTMTHNAPSTVTNATLSLSSGLTFGSVPGTTGSNTVRVLTVRNGSLQRIDVSVNLDKSFTAGTLTIRLGNLTKTVTIKRRPIISAAGGVLADFKDREYVVGDVIAGDPWLRLSSDPNGASPKSKVENPNGSIYMVLSQNVSTTGNARSGHLYLSRRNDAGRLRVTVYQEFFDIRHLLGQMYCGAFWRADQTGERLIRMYMNSSDLGAWTAKVMDNADWIILDTEQSDDPNIGWKEGANEALVADMNSRDAEFQVFGSATSVTGNAVRDEPLYFRIGLKTKLPSSTSAPRYGRVLLTYANNGKSHIIYIRQGEAPDILSAGTTLKWSPYNLEPLNQNYIVNPTQYQFTKYPTQVGGYKLPQQQPIMWAPNRKGSGFIPSIWDSSMGGIPNDVCAKMAGWRIPHPDEGLKSLKSTTNVNDKGKKRIHGLYADGNYDRRVIGFKNATERDKFTEARDGGLIVDLSSHRHVFFPYAYAKNKRLQDDGLWEWDHPCILHTKIGNTATANYFLIYSTFYDTNGIIDQRYSGGYDSAASVRCVRD